MELKMDRNRGSRSIQLGSATTTACKNTDHQHDNMLKQAIYNTGANVFVLLAGLGIIALYWVLETFFRPLMWAMLCGAFLHPFKYQVTKNIKSWLSGLKESGTPFVLGIFKIPIDLLDISSENLIQSLQRRWRVILGVTGVFLSLYITYHQAPMDFKQFTGFVWWIFAAFSNFISFFSFKWVCGLVICHLFAVAKLWSPENRQILAYISIPIWLLVLLCTIANSGALRLPLAVAIVVLMTVGYYTDAKAHIKEDNKSTAPKRSDSPENDASFSLSDVNVAQQWENLSNLFSRSMLCSTAVEDTVGGQLSPIPSEVEDHNENIMRPLELDDNVVQATAPTDTDHESSCAEDAHHISSDSEKSESRLSEPQRVIDVRFETAQDENMAATKPPANSRRTESVSNQTSIDKKKMRRRSDKCFIFLFWAIALVVLWSNVWLILLPLISFAFRLIKKLVQWLRWFVTTGYHERFSEDVEPVRVWCVQRLEVIIPMPIRGIIRILMKGDRRVVEVLLGSADTFITIMFILLLLVGFVLLSVSVCFQVQKEGIHLVTVTSNLVQNSTVQPQWFTDMLRDGGMNETDNIRSSLDPMITNLYRFGREWIVRQISERISHQPSRELVENELVGIWDSLYKSWVTKNTTMLAQPNYQYKGALFSHIRDGGVNFVWETITVDVNGIFNFVRENIGIFQSVVESVWILLKGNVNLAFTLLISLLQIILGGSTAILNSFLSLIVFFTTLFYLLASSSNDYKPVEWVSKLTIAKSGSKFAQAVEDGIGGVFAASLKMAAFYGVYTWLTHTVFGINIVFLPSLFAAILGAIPFVGTYWAAVPAVLELCLIHKEVFLGVLLAIFHVLPTFVVDTALYSDIKGGGHPYLTGLAIAGGIYCFGLQGAIVGPVLLCCIIVAMNLYSAIINPDQPSTPATPGSQSFLNLSQVFKDQSRPNLTRSASASNYEL